MKECVKSVLKEKKNCENKECRMWLNYSKEFNCAEISIIYNGPMKLKEIGERLSLTTVRIKQIEDEIFKKISKKKIFNILEE